MLFLSRIQAQVCLGVANFKLAETFLKFLTVLHAIFKLDNLTMAGSLVIKSTSTFDSKNTKLSFPTGLLTIWHQVTSDKQKFVNAIQSKFLICFRRVSSLLCCLKS